MEQLIAQNPWLAIVVVMVGAWARYEISKILSWRKARNGNGPATHADIVNAITEHGNESRGLAQKIIEREEKTAQVTNDLREAAKEQTEAVRDVSLVFREYIAEERGRRER